MKHQINFFDITLILMVSDMSWTQYGFFGFESCSISIKKDADSFSLLNDQSIIKVFNILTKENQTYAYGKRFLEIDKFFPLHVNLQL